MQQYFQKFASQKKLAIANSEEAKTQRRGQSFLCDRAKQGTLETQNSPDSLAQELDAIAQRCAFLPVQDSRSPEELIGYDERGLPQ